ncbi:probable cytochrome P450 9f2 [Phlebotomus argentipes]|uniref:probable cytochrome P450 9f2 n=1 Tax=Phlebotomus argentipes TaxID=94469 RepID=UPI002892CB06|nr:probable cytochrome P450 9f2 [Phlebotomus argentipes]
MLVYILLGLVAYFVYRWLTDNQNYFKARNIPEGERNYGFGTFFKIFLKQASTQELIMEYYNRFKNNQIAGLWEMNRPFYFIRDPKIVKKITVKSFDHFHDKVNIIDEHMDPFLGNSLVMLSGQKWRDMRATLSPAFTGSKMRLMCELIVEIGEQMVEYLRKEAKEKGPQTYDMKAFFSRVATDLIATCAFGVKVDSLHDNQNSFYVRATKLVDFTAPIKLLKFISFRSIPRVMKALGITLNTRDDMEFLRNLVIDAMKAREKNNIFRPDMIHLLMEAQKGKLTHTKTDKDSAGFATVEEASVGWKKSTEKWSEIEIVAQCFLFMMAGYETISTVVSFAVYELAINPDIQKKLHAEILQVHRELNGKRHNYDTLQRMKYLDMVVSEALRKWPPAPFTDRTCTEEFSINLNDGQKFTFEKGNIMWLPIHAFHRDPNFYPDPEKFDPERFSDENKDSIDPDTFIPFGIGPRNCIGSRFALMETKSVLFHLLLNFSIEVTSETQIPLVLAKRLAGLQGEKGIRLQFRPRDL